MFKKILIANRGEIACRVAHTARRLGVQTVAVYSSADRKAPHLEMCDEAVFIGPAPAQESYLCMDQLFMAAEKTGAEAIHPGYGFLSENPVFVRRCEAERRVFIGPPASAMVAMGSKSAAKSLMEKAGVPLVPGYHGPRQEIDFLQAQAEAMTYPVMIKASAGGGGKGMRCAMAPADFQEALSAAQREAKSSFGDDHVLLEKYLTRPRHVEVQIFADTHGHCVALFDRDCSIQRRHQKIVEEASAPNLPETLRQAMRVAAIAAASAVGYVGAGTVEFMVEGGAFYFMEMNTRLQVEHPVTEMITGLDLVEWQLRVAAGEALPAYDEPLAQGHAIEVRICAEDPDQHFLPSTGMLKHLRFPKNATFFSSSTMGIGGTHQPVIRVDTGVREGDVISPYYDSMIAKLIVWGRTREEACLAMCMALSQTQIVGIAHNVDFLRRIVASAAFSQAALDTAFIERHVTELLPEIVPVTKEALRLAVAALRQDEEKQAVTDDPWQQRDGWRLNGDYERSLVFSALKAQNERFVYPLRYSKDASENSSDDCARAKVVRDGDIFYIFPHNPHEQHTVLMWHDPRKGEDCVDPHGDTGRLTSPMPGKITAMLVVAGDHVAKGAPLLTMEAMKMEHTLYAPKAGVVTDILYSAGEQVGENVQLLILNEENVR